MTINLVSHEMLWYILVKWNNNNVRKKDTINIYIKSIYKTFELDRKFTEHFEKSK